MPIDYAKDYLIYFTVPLQRAALETFAYSLRADGRLVTVVGQNRRYRLTVGALLPRGSQVRSVRVDGHPAPFRVVGTARGRQVRVDGGSGLGRTRLVVTLR